MPRGDNAFVRRYISLGFFNCHTSNHFNSANFMASCYWCHWHDNCYIVNTEGNKKTKQNEAEYETKKKKPRMVSAVTDYICF